MKRCWSENKELCSRLGSGSPLPRKNALARLMAVQKEQEPICSQLNFLLQLWINSLRTSMQDACFLCHFLECLQKQKQKEKSKVVILGKRRRIGLTSFGGIRQHPLVPSVWLLPLDLSKSYFMLICSKLLADRTRCIWAPASCSGNRSSNRSSGDSIRLRAPSFSRLHKEF